MKKLLKKYYSLFECFFHKYDDSRCVYYGRSWNQEDTKQRWQIAFILLSLQR